MHTLVDIIQGSILITSIAKLIMTLCIGMTIVVLMGSSKIGNSITIVLILIATIARMQA